MKTLIGILMGVVICTHTVYAAINITVIPREGGTSLRFGRVDAGTLLNKEATVRVTSTDSVQYQVSQRLVEPFVNERGIPLANDVIRSYALRGSNSVGSLHQQDPIVLGFGEQLLYTSNPAGGGDSFRMIYRIDSSKLNATGSFFGKILFIVRPLGGGTQQTYVLNVYLETSGKLNVRMSTSAGSNFIRLGTKQEQAQGYADFSFSGNLGQTVRLYQEFFELPRNEKGDRIPQDSLVFEVKAAKGQGRYPTPSSIESNRILLYESSQPDDIITVQYLLHSSATLAAGTYRGQLTYVFDSFGAQQRYTANLEISVAPVFELTAEAASGSLHFTGVTPGSPAQEREVLITVRSNLGKPYMITHTLVNPLMNESAVQLPADLFTMKTEFVNADIGTLKGTGFRPVSKGETSLYFSNSEGSPVKIRIIYRVTSSLAVSPGDYTAVINYSLGEQ